MAFLHSPNLVHQVHAWDDREKAETVVDDRICESVSRVSVRLVELCLIGGDEGLASGLRRGLGRRQPTGEEKSQDLPAGKSSRP
jgi:hypothetical protein